MSTNEDLEMMQDRIRRAEEDFERALDAGGIGYWNWEIASDTLRWDKRMHLIFGTDPRNFVPKYDSFNELLVPEDRDRVAKEVAKSLETLEPFRNVFYTNEGRLIAGYGTVVVEHGIPSRLVGVNLLINTPDNSDNTACSIMCPLVKSLVDQKSGSILSILALKNS